MDERPEVSAGEGLHQKECEWLTRFLHRRVPPPDVVEDVLQDPWLSFWRLGERYAETGRRHALLQRIASRRAADWHRARPAKLVTGLREVPIFSYIFSNFIS